MDKYEKIDSKRKLYLVFAFIAFILLIVGISVLITQIVGLYDDFTNKDEYYYNTSIIEKYVEGQGKYITTQHNYIEDELPDRTIYFILAGFLLMLGFAGSSFCWISYFVLGKVKKVIKLVVHEKVDSINSLASLMPTTYYHALTYAKEAARRGYLDGYIVTENMIIDMNKEKLIQEDDEEEHVTKCDHCGMEFRFKGNIGKCPYCDSYFEIKK